MSLKSLSMKVGDWTFNYASLRDFEFDISEPHGIPDYIVFGEDTDNDGINDLFYAKNVKTGKIELTTSSLSTAINHSFTNGKFTFISSGTYYLDNTITLTQGNQLVGAGINATTILFKPSGNTSDVIYVDGGTGWCNGVSVRNMTIDANQHNAIHIYGANSYTASKGYYANLLIKNPDKGLFLDSVGTNVYKNYFENISFVKVYGYGIHVVNAPYNRFDQIEIVYTQDNSYAIYNSALNNYFGTVSTDGVVQDAGQNTVWEHLVIETIHPTTVPINAGVYFNGINIEAHMIILNNTDPAKVTQGLVLGGNTYFIGTLRQIGTLYPDYLFVPSALGTTKAIVFNIQGSSKYWSHLSDGRSKNIRYFSPGLYAYGTSTFSGDGTTTQFTIPHGLLTAPDPAKTHITPLSGDASGNFYITVDSTNIYVNYLTAPASGTDNIVLAWYTEV